MAAWVFMLCVRIVCVCMVYYFSISFWHLIYLDEIVHRRPRVLPVQHGITSLCSGGRTCLTILVGSENQEAITRGLLWSQDSGAHKFK